MFLKNRYPNTFANNCNSVNNHITCLVKFCTLVRPCTSRGKMHRSRFMRLYFWGRAFSQYTPAVIVYDNNIQVNCADLSLSASSGKARGGRRPHPLLHLPAARTRACRISDDEARNIISCSSRMMKEAAHGAAVCQLLSWGRNKKLSTPTEN